MTGAAGNNNGCCFAGRCWYERTTNRFVQKQNLSFIHDSAFQDPDLRLARHRQVVSAPMKTSFLMEDGSNYDENVFVNNITAAVGFSISSVIPDDFVALAIEPAAAGGRSLPWPPIVVLLLFQLNQQKEKRPPLCLVVAIPRFRW
jgi:hypothetical protein